MSWSHAAHAAGTNAPAPVLTPEQWFEGGTNTYNNWVDLSVGGLILDGSTAQGQQQYQLQKKSLRWRQRSALPAGCRQGKPR
ncbi:MAG: hypothetical protein WDM80_10480 [Limisphaerales bacterium]